MHQITRFLKGCHVTNLVFYICTITSLIDLDKQGVGTTYVDMLRDIEFTRVPGPLGIANLVVVKPAGESRIDALEAKTVLMVLWIRIQVESGDVPTALIVVDGNIGWVDGEGKVDVGILRSLAEALALPHSWNLDVIPFQVMKALGIEVGRSIQRRRREVELPCPR
jgi:hypothetical protein